MDPGQDTTAPVVGSLGSDRPVSKSNPLPGLVRSIGVGALLVVYALLPVESDATAWAIVVVAGVGLVAVGWVFIRQIPRIERASHPTIAAIRSLVFVFAMFAILFAFIYLSIAHNDPQAFSQPLSKLAALYFSVTVMTTVGFGDIVAVSDGARGLVTVHMVLAVILVGSAVKVLMGTAGNALATRQ